LQDRKHVLLATLGGQPQVVTFTLDLLLDTFPITNVIVLHPRPAEERLQRSLARLREEFTNDYYHERKCVIHFRSQVLQYEGKPIDDIRDDLHADGALDTIHQLITTLKRQGYRIHLSVTGGRRLMALLAISVATLNFDRHDRIWHIYTPQELQEEAREGRIMHVAPEAGVRLIQEPFLPLGAYIYPTDLSFRAAQVEQRSQMDAQDRAACASVVKEASPAQLKVLKAFGKGLRPSLVAKELDITLKTVHSHKTNLLRYCANAWNIGIDERLDYRFLQVKFASYFASDE
jgi:CRISPR-associated protein Csx14